MTSAAVTRADRPINVHSVWAARRTPVRSPQLADSGLDRLCGRLRAAAAQTAPVDVSVRRLGAAECGRYVVTELVQWCSMCCRTRLCGQCTRLYTASTQAAPRGGRTPAAHQRFCPGRIFFSGWRGGSGWAEMNAVYTLCWRADEVTSSSCQTWGVALLQAFRCASDTLAEK